MRASSHLVKLFLLPLGGCLPMHRNDGCDMRPEPPPPIAVHEAAAQADSLMFHFRQLGTADSVTGVRVDSDPRGIQVVADRNASVTIPVTPGRYSLRIRRIGYQYRWITLDIVAERQYQLDVTLMRCPVRLDF